MKKTFMFAVAAALFAATAGYSQSTSSPAGGTATQNKPATAAQPANGNQDKPGGQQAQKSQEEDGSTKPGGESNKNANDVGRYSSGNDEKSMLRSQEALDRRRKNLTESDTVAKDGSGSSPRNRKNHTGKTGNYRNRDAKQSQKPASDE